ncbi:MULTISPECIES: autotransporter domain-containing protein [unclassified Pseudomonas]|uniref:autotransporter domain-containing protein n=1 Tax=unclassified Pseudomonas TaxID=196821 RepID=UPI000BD73D9E|nr:MULTISPECIES: autotransporter domain-containing protein [unclassified Pseudomonas]PVZ20484.1 putative HAF family extracellular repeat protein [Pseudomonas sp. URIL14HWK12:I12]PVZ27550.1 putative HAF family extracellular repeat protein [Pseudomonas sp. URIL14HWK12:I10]PVZ38439.1 putative HAF family extracellular repeat protein [Pseudomonas sp. URIL14HWK12:I11]SNZ03351.1 probable extracellular repeat, HAF family [Pseudomonas sp. URIL14HWK12:I9]
MPNHADLCFPHARRSIKRPGALSLLAASIVAGAAPLSDALASELIDFYSSTGPYLAPVFLSANGETAVGGLANNTGPAQVGRLGGRTFENIGSLNGGATYARGLSDDGSTIVGVSEISPGGNNHAFRWKNGVMTDLGTFGGNYADATAVSADGSVVVGQAGLASGSMAFRWESGTLQALGTLGGSDSFARAVSADGTSVVGVSSLPNRNLHAFLWQAGAITDLGTLGGDHSTATAINANGQVVVGASFLAGSSAPHAFRWSAGTMQDLGTLGGYYSDAQFISADGSVVVGNSILADNLNNRLFRWEAGAMVDLGSLGGSAVQASDMNPAGTVVVGAASNTQNQNQAFRWSLAGGLQTVDAWLADNGVPISSVGQRAVTAAAVSDDGNVIIGQLNNGHQYLARIVAPAAPPVVSPPPTVTPTLPPPSAPGSGLIDVDDFMAGLSAVRMQASTITLNTSDLILNGLHGNPMRGLLPAGNQSIWVSGDIGRNRQEAADGNTGLGEIGYGVNLTQGWQVNLALGRTADVQHGPVGSHTRVESTYVVPELTVQLPNTSAYTTFSLLYSRGTSDIDRGYLNAGLQRTSQGDSSVTSWGGRVRLDLLNAFSLAGAGFTPYVSHTLLRTRLDGYTETSGGFPVAWSPSTARSQISRLGVDAVKPLGPSVTLLGRVEGAHRFEGQSPRAEGDLLGTGGGRFSLPGADYTQSWLRVGTGAEVKLGAGMTSLMLNVTTEGEAPNYWATVGYQLKF